MGLVATLPSAEAAEVTSSQPELWPPEVLACCVCSAMLLAARLPSAAGSGSGADSLLAEASAGLLAMLCKADCNMADVIAALVAAAVAAAHIGVAQYEESSSSLMTAMLPSASHSQNFTF